MYEGLLIEPQLGLLPLGRDSDSGLWEFWHVQSGDMPQRGPDGKLQLTETSGLVLVLIPGGSFWMGAQDSEGYQNHDSRAQSDENPVHLVTLSPYFLSKYEMTQGQWIALTGHNPSNYSAGKIWADRKVTMLHPVEQVSWEGTMAVLPRWGLQHPTEAQWERAARGGTESPFWSGFDRETLQEPLAANIADQTTVEEGTGWSGNRDWPEFNDGWLTHAPVDTMAPNPYGLLHIHGNVWEWCLDSWGAYYYSRSPSENPNHQPPVSRHRAFRGGAFNSSIFDVRVSNRNNFTPAGRDNNLGLRPARTLTP
ncbi:MAG: sulfatase activating formylglycine-generating enzyme [Pseudohongiellaceae bacterium]